MKAGPAITRFKPDGLVFSDGIELSADVVVFSTGFVGNMRVTIEQIFGQEVADEVGDIWGVNEEGEVKGAYRRTGGKCSFPLSNCNRSLVVPPTIIVR